MCTFGSLFSWNEQGKVNNPEKIECVWVEQLHSVLPQQISTLESQSAQHTELKGEGSKRCYNLQTQSGGR